MVGSQAKYSGLALLVLVAGVLALLALVPWRF
jgi:hypothetical protein